MSQYLLLLETNTFRNVKKIKVEENGSQKYTHSFSKFLLRAREFCVLATRAGKGRKRGLKVTIFLRLQKAISRNFTPWRQEEKSWGVSTYSGTSGKLKDEALYVGFSLGRRPTHQLKTSSSVSALFFLPPSPPFTIHHVLFRAIE